MVLAGHDISAGGMITTLLEMTFAQNEVGLDMNLSSIHEPDLVKTLFSQNPGLILQVDFDSDAFNLLEEDGIKYKKIGKLFDEYNIRFIDIHTKFEAGY